MHSNEIFFYIKFSVSIIKSVATVTGISVVTRTLSFLFKIYLSRSVGAEVLGLYQICLSVFFLFIALTTGGLSTVLSRKIAESEAVGNTRKPAEYLTTALVIAMSAAAITLLTCYLLLPEAYLIISDERALPLLKIMLPALITTTFYIIIRGWFWGTKQFGVFSLTELMEEILRIAFTLFFVSGLVSGIEGATGIALAFTVSDVLVALAVLVIFIKKGGEFARGVKAKELLRPAAPLTAMRVFGSAAGTVLALILPEALISSGATITEATAAVGRISGMANPLLMAPNAIIGSLAVVLIPEMSADNARGDHSALNKRIDSGISFAVIVSGLFLVVYIALGEELTSLIYNDRPSGEYLAVAAWLMLLTPVNQIVTSSLNSVGMEKESFLTFVPATAVMIAMCMFLPQYIGIYAVVAANAACLLIEVVGNLILLNRKVKLKFGFLKSVVAVAVFAIPVGYFIRSVYGMTYGAGSFRAIALSAAAGGAMYAALAYGTGLIDVGSLLKRFRRSAA